MTVTGTVDELGALLARIAAESDGTPAGNRIDLTAAWRSRTAEFYRFYVTGLPHPDLVIKVLSDAATAHALYDSMRQTNDALTVHVAKGIAAPQPLGWSEAHQAVVMPYVSGRPLNAVLSRARWNQPGDLESALDMVGRCGQMLGAFHARFVSTDDANVAQAQRDITRRMNIVLQEGTFDLHLMKDAVVARRYGDFHAGHVIVTGPGELVLIDPPLDDRCAYVHVDIAWFLDHMFMQLHAGNPVTGFIRRSPLRELEDQFFAGYAATAPHCLGSRDRGLVAGVQASLLSRRLSMLVRRRSALHLMWRGAPMWMTYKRRKREFISHLSTEGGRAS